MKKLLSALSLVSLWLLVSLSTALLGLPSYLVAALFVEPSTSIERLALFAMSSIGAAWAARLIAFEVVKLVSAKVAGSAAKEIGLAATEKMSQLAREKLASMDSTCRHRPRGSKLDS